MKTINPGVLKDLYKPDPLSHKGQNGRVMIIGGSVLFHAASLWSLEIASKIVDMVFYSSVDINNEIVKNLKEEFRNGIIVPRSKIDDYIKEADSVLIGPGLPRKEGEERGDDDTKNITERLLAKYPEKKWVIDGGSLQTIDCSYIPAHSILTPHPKEFEKLFGLRASEVNVKQMALKHKCVIVLKGPKDFVSNGEETVVVEGGNAGMTKGGTGDVLAGLTVALYAKNEAFLSALSASFINKKAGERLFENTGYFFNASDLVSEIPKTMKELIL